MTVVIPLGIWQTVDLLGGVGPNKGPPRRPHGPTGPSGPTGPTGSTGGGPFTVTWAIGILRPGVDPISSGSPKCGDIQTPWTAPYDDTLSAFFTCGYITELGLVVGFPGLVPGLVITNGPTVTPPAAFGPWQRSPNVVNALQYSPEGTSNSGTTSASIGFTISSLLISGGGPAFYQLGNQPNPAQGLYAGGYVIDNVPPTVGYSGTISGAPIARFNGNLMRTTNCTVTIGPDPGNGDPPRINFVATFSF